MSRVPRVLVVEDEQDIAVLIKHALERSGDAQVDVVHSGDTAKVSGLHFRGSDCANVQHRQPVESFGWKTY